MKSCESITFFVACAKSKSSHKVRTFVLSQSEEVAPLRHHLVQHGQGARDIADARDAEHGRPSAEPSRCGPARQGSVWSPGTTFRRPFFARTTSRARPPSPADSGCASGMAPLPRPRIFAGRGAGHSNLKCGCVCVFVCVGVCGVWVWGVWIGLD